MNLEKISKAGMKLGATIALTGFLFLGHSDFKYFNKSEEIKNNAELKKSSEEKIIFDIYTLAGGLLLFSASYLGRTNSQLNKQKKESEENLK